MACVRLWVAVVLLLLGSVGADAMFLGPGIIEANIMAIAAAAFGACLPFSCTTSVSTGNECLVERFGKYHRRLTPGWHVVYWPIESISMKGSLREQVLDVPPQHCYTRDNAPIT